VEKTKKLLGGKIKGKTIGILGLSFKPDTDDMRDAPSIVVINTLLGEGAIIKAYDPIAMNNAKKILKNVDFQPDSYSVAKDCDILIVMTEWNEFRQLDLEKIKKYMRKPVLLDGRNIYEPHELRRMGFMYTGVGR
jgi:UDPglucose 6-dehydrogenase